jgi:hypothetical protein
MKDEGSQIMFKFFRIFFILLISSFILYSTGCAALGVLIYKIMGPAPVAAKYVPAQTPMLVLVENRSQPSATVGPDVLSAYVSEDLTDNKVAPLVPPEELQKLRDSKKAEYAKMSVETIGKMVNASQVLWLQMEEDEVSPLQGGEGVTGHAQVRVKLVDVASGDLIWPKTQADGYLVSASTSLGIDSTHAVAQDVHRHIYVSLATQIGRLFHKWTPEDERPQQ